ncbi:hypothetical protein F5Y13DRAFT_206831 [Hypoxylon sp. FL1857]|nr:hypothetical protein F5Y13DRAFT_206831 [Hypoxylon sp. FL1857]
MSCHWRLTSHDQWEMSQSNPPSELPNDPIISTSSNPDERSSSPAAQSEPSRESHSVSAHQMGDSLFSHAAQAETEPIPRDGDISDPQDMLLPDSPIYSSLLPDVDDHIVPLHPKQANTMVPPKPNSQGARRRKDANTTKSDLDDSDFEILESDDDDSDSDYVAETTTRRGGKRKASNKTARGKATTKHSTHDTTVLAKGFKAAASKGRSQQLETASKTASKRTKQAANAAGVRNSVANTSADSGKGSARTSGRTQGGNKAKTGDLPDNVISNSQILPAERRARPKHGIARVPKPSFYNESKGSSSIQVAQNTNTTKSQLSSVKKMVNKQSSSSRNNRPPASPIVVDDDDDDDNDDEFYLPDSPVEQGHNPLPETKTDSKASRIIPKVTVGPNSKKKRSPLQPGPASKNAKKTTTRTYGQKAASKLGSSDLFRSPIDEGVQLKKRPSPVESREVKDRNVASSNQSAISFLKEADHPHHTEEKANKNFKRKAARPRTLNEAPSEVTTSGLDPQPSVDVAPAPSPKPTLSKFFKPNTQAIPETKSPTSIPLPNTINDESEHEAIQSLTARGKPRDIEESNIDHVHKSNTTNSSSRKAEAENFPDSHRATTIQQVLDFNEGKSKAKSSPDKQVQTSPLGPSTWPSARKATMSGTQGESDKFDIYIDPPQNDPVPIEKQPSFPKEAHGHPELDVAPMQIDTRSRVNELGSPSKHLNTTAGAIATSERSLQELRHPTNQEKQAKLPARPQASFNHSLPWRQQMTSDFEPQLARADSPPPTSHVKRPQASNVETFKTIKDLDQHHHQPMSNPPARIVLSPSSSAKHSAEHTAYLVPQLPQLDPRSIEFARRVAQEQKKTKYNNQDAEEEALNVRKGYNPAKWPSLLPSKVSMKQRDNSQLSPPKADKLSHVFRDQLTWGRDNRPRDPASKPGYETKWQEAVDAASGGVIDTLHFISTNLLEHLRTREQSISAVVNEYERNGTKVSEKLAKRQTGEWLSASTTVEHKCLELATLYGGLSKKTQEFRAKCLSKHHNQAYAEWQRQTARIKAAIRTAREEALLG